MLTRLLCAAALMLPAVAFAQETAPPKLGPNLLQNGDFESKAENGLPPQWKFSSAMPQIFQSKIVAEKNGNHVLELTSLAPQMSGYWEQNVPVAVKPHTKYLARGRAKLDRGTLFLWILGADYPGNKTPDTPTEARSYVESLVGHPLAPLYWKTEWALPAKKYGIRGSGPLRVDTAAPGEWKTLELLVDSGEARALRFSVGAFFAAGTYTLDDFSLQEVTS
jgi:hypothetical protein